MFHERLDKINESYNTKNNTNKLWVYWYSRIIKGASQGEGLGNKFLSHIKEVDAIVEVVRCFDSTNVIHVEEGEPLKRYRNN